MKLSCFKKHISFNNFFQIGYLNQKFNQVAYKVLQKKNLFVFKWNFSSTSDIPIYLLKNYCYYSFICVNCYVLC